MREVQDHYFREAKREGYRSRAAYKLLEIDDRKHVLSPGDRVLDCGAAPGSWLQVAARRVGPRGLVIGIDLQPIVPAPEPNVRTIRGDLQEIPAAHLRAALEESMAGAADGFDVILSDMAPSTTGDRTIDHHQSMRLCHAVLDRCRDLLRKGGDLVMKALEGEAYRELLDRTGSMFESVKGYKPKASRDVSTEMYLVAHGFRGEQGEVGGTPPKPPPRPTGW